jgi:hypothetical protein
MLLGERSPYELQGPAAAQCVFPTALPVYHDSLLSLPHPHLLILFPVLSAAQTMGQIPPCREESDDTAHEDFQNLNTNTPNTFYYKTSM